MESLLKCRGRDTLIMYQANLSLTVLIGAKIADFQMASLVMCRGRESEVKNGNSVPRDHIRKWKACPNVVAERAHFI